MSETDCPSHSSRNSRDRRSGVRSIANERRRVSTPGPTSSGIGGGRGPGSSPPMTGHANSATRSWRDQLARTRYSRICTVVVKDRGWSNAPNRSSAQVLVRSAAGPNVRDVRAHEGLRSSGYADNASRSATSSAEIARVTRYVLSAQGRNSLSIPARVWSGSSFAGPAPTGRM